MLSSWTLTTRESLTSGEVTVILMKSDRPKVTVQTGKMVEQPPLVVHMSNCFCSTLSRFSSQIKIDTQVQNDSHFLTTPHRSRGNPHSLEPSSKSPTCAQMLSQAPPCTFLRRSTSIVWSPLLQRPSEKIVTTVVSSWSLMISTNDGHQQMLAAELSTMTSHFTVLNNFFMIWAF